MIFKVPNLIADRPAEALIAVVLLFGLLFIAADGTPPEPHTQAVGTQVATSEKN